MSKEFVFEDVTITEEDITDEMIRKECIAYLLGRINVSNYLRESITVAESERLGKWVQELDVDTATLLILGEQEPAAGRKGKLRKAAVAIGGAGKVAGKAVVGAGKVAGKAVVGAGKAAGKAVVGAGKAVGKGAAVAGKYAKAHPVKAAGIAAATIGAGLAARALWKKRFGQCAKQCAGAADKADCFAKCKAAAKTIPARA